ncbi:MAG: DUF547 domain-containing protein [Lewinella sp.]|nr:DUF547 domain-containing protein [Lewinella sp.]
MLRIKKQEDPTLILQALAQLPPASLLQDLPDDHHKKATWINLYNAFFLHLRRDQQVSKDRIYRERLIMVAGQSFSLDEIEHGILRRWRWKWSLGYLPAPFTRPLIRQLAVDHLDYRIHFALNCGARGCPPIAFYRPDRLEQELDLATQSFLESETIVDADTRTIHLTRLARWYLGDFGGFRGLRHILHHQLGLGTRGYRLRFREYDWTEELG